MNILFNGNCLLATAFTPAFGSQVTALAFVFLVVAAFAGAVALFGQYLAATHPNQEPGEIVNPSPNLDDPNRISVIIAAAVSATLGPTASVRQITAAEPQPQSVEQLMQYWSLEGRRQIYSSHKVR